MLQPRYLSVVLALVIAIVTTAFLSFIPSSDLVTMTIIDVFETDVDGRLLSYCPTFDNRAVHKTQEAVERIRKGASQIKQRMEVIAKSPAGKRVNKAAGQVGRIGKFYSD